MRFWRRAEWNSMSGMLLAIEGKRLSPLRGLGFPCFWTGGSASLHPRLCSGRPFGARLQTAVLKGIRGFAVRSRNGVGGMGMRGRKPNLSPEGAERIQTGASEARPPESGATKSSPEGAADAVFAVPRRQKMGGTR